LTCYDWQWIVRAHVPERNDFTQKTERNLDRSYQTIFESSEHADLSQPVVLDCRSCGLVVAVIRVLGVPFDFGVAGTAQWRTGRLLTSKDLARKIKCEPYSFISTTSVRHLEL